MNAIYSRTVQYLNVSEEVLNRTAVNEDYDRAFQTIYEDYFCNDPVFNLGRLIITTTFSVIILFGTIGNLRNR